MIIASQKVGERDGACAKISDRQLRHDALDLRCDQSVPVPTWNSVPGILSHELIHHNRGLHQFGRWSSRFLHLISFYAKYRPRKSHCPFRYLTIDSLRDSGISNPNADDFEMTMPQTPLPVKMAVLFASRRSAKAILKQGWRRKVVTSKISIVCFNNFHPKLIIAC